MDDNFKQLCDEYTQSVNILNMANGVKRLFLTSLRNMV